MLWRVEIGLLASADEVDRLTDEIIRVLCPDPDHEGACDIPWSLTTVDGESLSTRKRRDLIANIESTNG